MNIQRSSNKHQQKHYGEWVLAGKNRCQIIFCELSNVKESLGQDQQLISILNMATLK